MVNRVLGRFRPTERERAIRAVGKELRLRYQRRGPRLPQRYRFLDEIKSGPGAPKWRAYNVLTGRYKDLYVKVFDVSRHQQHNEPDSHFSCFLFQHDQDFPEVRIYRREAYDLIQFCNAIDTEIVEVEAGPKKFRDQFIVRARDVTFAHAVCSEVLMYYLVGMEEGACEIERNVVCIRFPGRVDPDRIRLNLDRLVRLREYMPESDES